MEGTDAKDPHLWKEIIVAHGCTQTPIKGIIAESLYAADIKVQEPTPFSNVLRDLLQSMFRREMGFLSEGWNYLFSKEHF